MADSDGSGHQVSWRPVRARSSAGEHPPYKREVAGSKPAAPTSNNYRTAARWLRTLPLLVAALDTAAWAARVLGHHDLAHALAVRGLEAAQHAEDAANTVAARLPRGLLTA